VHRIARVRALLNSSVRNAAVFPSDCAAIGSHGLCSMRVSRSQTLFTGGERFMLVPGRSDARCGLVCLLLAVPRVRSFDLAGTTEQMHQVRRPNCVGQLCRLSRGTAHISSPGSAHDSRRQFRAARSRVVMATSCINRTARWGRAHPTFAARWGQMRTTQSISTGAMAGTERARSERSQIVIP